MSPRETEEILDELAKMEPDIRDKDWDYQYQRAYDTYNKLDNWKDYSLTEMVDPWTFDKVWFWRKKS